MRRVPEVHWAEGMFLRPQHLQMFGRQVTARVADVGRQVQPFFWGVASIEVAEDQLEGFEFAVRQFEAVLKDGTRIHLPSNLQLSPRDFKKHLDASDGRLPVYFGVPVLQDGERNTQTPEYEHAKDLRFVVDNVDVADENLGGEARPLEIRKLNGRFFFGNEDKEGYECLPVAIIERASYGKHVPVLAQDFVPSVTEMAASPVLVRLGESVRNRVEAKYRFLRAEVAEGRMVFDTEGTGGWQPILKLQIVASFLHVLRQLIGLPGVHPFQLYLELSRLAGELSIFDEGGAEALPVELYEHDRLGHCFYKLVNTVNQLLDQILAGGFVHVSFRMEGELLIALLEDEWLVRGNQIYLCIQSELNDRQLLNRIETVKIGASTDLPVLKQRRLFGLDIDLLKRHPAGLPGRPELHYFDIAQEGQYWRSVVERREVAVSGGIDPKLKFSLYIITKSGSDHNES